MRLALLLAAFSAIRLPGAVVPDLGPLPIAFEPNRGQYSPEVQFGARTESLRLSVLASAIRIETPGTQNPLEIQWAGGQRLSIEGEGQLPGTSNYILGASPARWRTNIPTFAKVRVHNIQSGVDLVVYGNQNQLEYDLDLAAGVAAESVSLHLTGARRLSRTKDGDLLIDCGSGLIIREHRPVVYQFQHGRKVPLVASYRIRGSDVSFRVAKHDAAKPLVIDPMLSFSAEFGGTGSDRGKAVAVDSSGYIYIVGDTSSLDFPMVQPYEDWPTTAASVSNPRHIFVTKLLPDASNIVFSTYLGGSSGESGRGVAVDPSGNTYVIGSTVSTNYPVTTGTLQSTTTPTGRTNHIVLTKLSTNGGSLVYSAVIGGSSDDEVAGLAIDGGGDAFLTGTTNSTDFPVTNGAHNDLEKLNGLNSAAKIFVTEVNPTATAFVYSAVIGGTGVDQGTALAIDGSGNAYIAGTTTSTDFPVTQGALETASNITGSNTRGVIAKIAAGGASVAFATYLGGTGSEQMAGLALDYAGNIFVTGLTTSSNFPTTSGSYLAPINGSANAVFITKIKTDGSAILYSSIFGGMNNAVGGIAVDQNSQASVAGTVNNGLAVTAGAPQILPGDGAAPPGVSGTTNAFVLELNSAGTAPVFSTYLGGVNASASAITVDQSGDVIVTGSGDSSFPVTAGTYESVDKGQVFVAEISESSSCSFSVNGVTALSATVTAPAGCNWIAVSGVPWIGVSSGQSGSGNGTVQLVAAQNTGIQRSGVVSIAGVQFTVTQSNACNFSLSSTTESFTSAGGPGSFSAFTSMGCTLPTAVSSVSWIHITSGAGVSPFTFTVNASTLGFARSGTITLGSQVFTVIEAAVPTMVQVTFNANISGVTLTTIGVGCSPGAYTLPITLSWASGAACIVNMPAPNGYAFALWMDGPTASSRTITAGASAATYSGVFSGCTYSVTAPGKIVNAAGGSLSITISTQTGCSWMPAPSAAWALAEGGGAGAGSGTATLTLIANPGLPRKTTVSVVGSSVTVHQAGIAYPIVFRPSNGTWYVSQNGNPGKPEAQQWGGQGDVPVPGDYDGDGKPDFAVWRPSTGYWYIILSSTPASPIAQQWGLPGDIPVPGDYDGDGKTDFAVWRPSTGMWYVIPSSAPGTLLLQQWGSQGDIPVPGDYDGDGKTDFAVWRPSTGTWYVIPSATPTVPVARQWGGAGDIPTPADFDGDGKTDFAIFRPSVATWYVIPSATPTVPVARQWGGAGDVPTPADFDGDGKADFAIFRPSTGTWWVIPSASPASPLVAPWGALGDIPAVTPLPN